MKFGGRGGGGLPGGPGGSIYPKVQVASEHSMVSSYNIKWK